MALMRGLVKNNIGRLKRRVIVWRRVAREKPLFLLNRLLLFLVVRTILISVCVFFSVLFTTATGQTIDFSGRVDTFLRDLPGKLQSLQLETIFRAVRGIPTEVNRLLAKLAEVIAMRKVWLQQALGTVWPPKQAYERLKSFFHANRHRARQITRATITFVLSLILLKLALLFALPVLSALALTVLGLNISLIIITLILQTIVALASTFLGKELHRKLLAWYETRQERLAAKAHLEKLQGQATDWSNNYIAWLMRQTEKIRRRYERAKESWRKKTSDSDGEAMLSDAL